MNPQLLFGVVDMLILEIISPGPSYGYEIVKSVVARGNLELKEGSLYPALHRLERQKLLSAYWAEAEGRRRKYYRITTAGRKTLEAKRREWESFTSGIKNILDGADGLA
jgi:PadR family transcriptional regulator, regulatory protein PadR